jgi:HK97 family phage major capsid protein
MKNKVLIAGGLGLLAVAGALLLWHQDVLNLQWAAAAGVCLAIAPGLMMTEEQVKEFKEILGEFKTGWHELRSLPGTVQATQEETGRLREQLTDARRLLAARGGDHRVARAPGGVTDACARHLAGQFVAHCERSGKLEALCSLPAQRDALVNFARNALNLTTRAALTAAEIPLPDQFAGEIRELTSEFGVVRRRMTRYPIGLGTSRPARMGARPAFGAIAMAAPFTEKSPAFSFASLESHKIGGIVRLPRELDEQSIVSLGHFLARYGAVEFARAEDTFGFLADGSGEYESVKGIVQTARENGKTVSLAAAKTKPSDATLDDFRALRRAVNKAALSGRFSAYYLDSTWETRLAAFRTAAEPNVYQRLPDGSAVLDGYPVVWADVLEPYGTAAAADKPIAVFGALSFWWFGEHGSPRLDTSEHVWFANDQLAVRFIEEIDFDYAAEDATAALLTAAS